MKRTVKPSYRFYRSAHRIARILFSILFRFECRGADNIPSGAAMVCSNHSSYFDPILIAFAFGAGCYLHFMAKVELFKAPVLAFVVAKLGAISVNRDTLDISTIKRTLDCFKNGEKVAIFPEGTRSSAADRITAKNGAVKIAERAGVPLLPIFVPRKKRLFGKVTLVIGEPYYLEKQSIKRSSDDYTQLAETLMKKIEALNPEGHRAEG